MRRERRYEGRRLPRQHEEVVDQGLAFDLETLTRRRALSVFGLGALGLGLAACGANGDDASPSTSKSPSPSGTGDVTEIPEETAGPYPGDGSNGPDVLEQSGVVRGDITASFGDADGVAEGVPITLRLTIIDIAAGGAPFKGAAVYVWHCTREGGYSMYTEGITEQNFLRGVQIADADGVVEFASIFPGCYSGRWPHIHFEVYPDQSSITDTASLVATSQIALPQNVCDTVYKQDGYEASVDNLARITLDSDNVFGEDAGVHQIATVKGDVQDGYDVALTVGVDTRTEPGQGGNGGPGNGGPPDGGPPNGDPPDGGPGDGGSPPRGR